MTLFYLATSDRYLSSTGEIYTNEQVDLIDEMEREWKDALPKYSFRELMSIFPEAVVPARRSLRTQLKKCKKDLSDINETQISYQENVINKADFREQTILIRSSNKYYNKLRDVVTQKEKKIQYKLRYLFELDNGEESKKPVGGVSEDDIIKAKEVSLEDLFIGKLLILGNHAKGRCPFHSEKTPSFTIYLHQNTWWCYGCNIGGSSIDFVMRQSDKNFLEAVKQLIK